MKKGEKKFLIVLLVLFVGYVATSFLAPKPINWAVTFKNQDKNPFGGHILSERSPDLFEEQLEISYKTISELHGLKNLLILSEYADIAGPDFRSLLAKLDSGTHVFIAANQFSNTIQDSLGFSGSFSFHVLNQDVFEAARSKITTTDDSRYEYPFSLVSNYFLLEQDSSSLWEEKAWLEEKPVVISKQIGKGRLTLCSTPYVFTNFGLLFNENYEGAAKILSLLPPEKTHFTLFYQLGKAEATTPFRYFLRQPPLKWSIYLALFTVVVFLLITSRRVQRPIPVMASPANATVDYVKTLGTLFYREGKHRKAAQRLTNYFLREIREKYFLQIDYSEKFYKQLSAKSGVDLTHVIQTFELIQQTKNQKSIDEKLLIDLSNKIEKF